MSISILIHVYRPLWLKYSGHKEPVVPEMEICDENISPIYHTWTMDFRDGDAMLTATNTSH